MYVSYGNGRMMIAISHLLFFFLFLENAGRFLQVSNVVYRKSYHFCNQFRFGCLRLFSTQRLKAPILFYCTAFFFFAEVRIFQKTNYSEKKNCLKTDFFMEFLSCVALGQAGGERAKPSLGSKR